VCYRSGKLSSVIQRDAVDIDSRLFSYCRERNVAISYGPRPSLLRGMVALFTAGVRTASPLASAMRTLHLPAPLTKCKRLSTRRCLTFYDFFTRAGL